MDVYRQRERFSRRMRFLDQEIANRQAWAPRSEILDLADPSGYRYLFDPPTRRAQYPFNVSDVT